MTFGNKALEFYRRLGINERLPETVEVMNPYLMPKIQGYVKRFCCQFFSDNEKRIFVFGINPGRFGAGLTGITFTDPVALSGFCGIANDLPQKREISSEFIYEFIGQWGGVKKFYNKFFLTAVSPLGFIRNGINCNYYERDVFLCTKPFVVKTLKEQLDIGANRHAAIVLGSGKNQETFNELNAQHCFFGKTYALEHPRFIMQYRRKCLSEYIKKYEEIFSLALQG